MLLIDCSSQFFMKNKSYYANTTSAVLSFLIGFMVTICFLNEGLDNPRQEFCGADFQNFEREVSVTLI